MNLYNYLVVEFCELLNELIDLCVKVVDAPRASKARKTNLRYFAQIL